MTSVTQRKDTLRFPLVAVLVWGGFQGLLLLLFHGPARGQYFQWDGWWYHQILLHGYVAGGRTATRSTAFFPLLPWITAVIRVVVRSDAIAGLLVEIVATTAATVLVYLVITRCRGERVARLTIVLWLAFPASIFLWQFYTESLCVAATAGAVFFAQENRWRESSALSFAATMTRLTGAFIVPALMVRAWQRRQPRRAWMLPAIGAVGFIPVALVQGIQAGEPFGFLAAGRAWGRHLTWPWVGIISFFHHATEANRPDVGQPIDLIAVTLFVVLTILIFHRPWPTELRVFLLLAVVVPLASGTLQSGARYMEVAWPGFAVAADVLDRQPVLIRALVIVGCLFLATMALRAWSSGLFVG